MNFTFTLNVVLYFELHGSRKFLLSYLYTLIISALGNLAYFVCCVQNFYLVILETYYFTFYNFLQLFKSVSLISFRRTSIIICFAYLPDHSLFCLLLFLIFFVVVCFSVCSVIFIQRLKDYL